jgi:hypothetical protein
VGLAVGSDAPTDWQPLRGPLSTAVLNKGAIGAIYAEIDQDTSAKLKEALATAGPDQVTVIELSDGRKLNVRT